jgi:hypothetical protein
MSKELEQDFNTVIRNAIEFVANMDNWSVIKVRGKVVKINLPLEVAENIPHALPPRTSKPIRDNGLCLFVGIPCEVKKGIKNIQYVIEGEIIQ